MYCKITVGKNTYVGVGSMAKVSVGGDLDNLGKFEVRGRGELEVARNMLNTGNITIDDPVTYKEVVLEGIKTTGNVAEFGTYVLRKLGIMF